MVLKLLHVPGEESGVGGYTCLILQRMCWFPESNLVGLVCLWLLCDPVTVECVANQK